MKKKTRIILWIVIAILILAAFVWWQMWQLGRGLRTVHADNAQEVLLSAMSPEVLAPDVDGGDQQSRASRPLLDQYRKDPNLTHQRYLLVMTWVHASQIYKATDWSAFDGKMLGSDTLTNVPSDSRVDGWNNPFCMWVGQKQVVFISSGGNGVPDCNVVQQIAGEAVAASHDAKLTRAGNLLVTVQSRSGGATALESH
jgi:hypothetical protein